MAFFVGDKEYPLLGTSAFDFIILDNELLLEHFDGVQFLRCLRFSKHNFAKIALSEHGQEVEVIEANTTTGALRVCGWRDFLLLLLLLWLVLLLYLLQSLLMLLLRLRLRGQLNLWGQSGLTIHRFLLRLILRLLLTIRLNRISTDAGISSWVVLWLLLTAWSIPIITTLSAISTRCPSPSASRVVCRCSLIRWR